MNRDRLNTAPVGPLLTFTQDIGYYDCENFILESAIAKYNGFPNWLAHLATIELAFSEHQDVYGMGDNFQRIKNIVISGLRKSRFDVQANRLENIHEEEGFNAELIRQYTDNGLYHEVNRVLRHGHFGDDVGNHDLAPWILQLNAAIRRLPEVPGNVYRGTSMSGKDLHQYTKGQIFIWSSFASFSRSEEKCFGGNVLFQMRGVSGLATRDKRAPRDIAPFSVLPDEQEVIMPICGAYRVNEVAEKNGRFVIDCDILDHY